MQAYVPEVLWHVAPFRHGFIEHALSKLINKYLILECQNETTQYHISIHITNNIQADTVIAYFIFFVTFFPKIIPFKHKYICT